MKKVICFLMVMLTSQMTLALDLYCSGKILKTQVTKDNFVFISPDWHTAATIAVCKLDGTWNSVPSTVCQQWMASVQSAMYLNKTVLVRYNATASASCAAMPNWELAEAPRLIEFYK